MDRNAPLKYHPGDGELYSVNHGRIDADMYRRFYPAMIWRFNPWTGFKRGQAEIDNDRFGHGMAVPSEGATPEQRVSPPMNAKYNPQKPLLHLIPREALEGMAAGFRYGAFDRKPVPYGPNNWRVGAPWTQYADAAMRHLTQWLDGQDMDPDTEQQVHHLDLALSGLAILRTYVVQNIGKDDRHHINKLHKENKPGQIQEVSLAEMSDMKKAATINMTARDSRTLVGDSAFVANSAGHVADNSASCDVHSTGAPYSPGFL